MLVGMVVFLFARYEKDTTDWLSNERQMCNAETLFSRLSENEIADMKIYFSQRDSAGFAATNGDLAKYLDGLDKTAYSTAVEQMPVPDEEKYESGWGLFQHKIPMWLFIITCLYLAVLSFRHNLSLIPVLGLVFCFYMMAQIPAHSWFGFFIWLVAGLVIYFGYGYANSKLAVKN
jgi:APA family basic amino acid/polyamine antiporter